MPNVAHYLILPIEFHWNAVMPIHWFIAYGCFDAKTELSSCSRNSTAQGNSLAIQWLGLHTLTAEGPGSIPGRGTKIPQAAWRGQINKS